MNPLREPGGRPSDEQGLTLAELLVSSMLLLIVLAVGGGVLRIGAEQQRDVRAVFQAANGVQTTARSLEVGIRNAADVSLTSPGPGRQLLVVLTRDLGTGVTTWTCQGWYYADGALHTRRVPEATAPTPAITAPTSTAQLEAQWKEVASGLRPTTTGGTTIFTPHPNATDTTRIDVDLLASAGARKPVALSTTFATRPHADTGGAQC